MHKLIKVLADASLDRLVSILSLPFELEFFHNYKDLQAREDVEVLVCRSNIYLDSNLLADKPNLRYVATASSGTDHIDKAYLLKNNIGLIDGRGGNASAVVDYVMACISYLKKYREFKLNKLGIIGLGEVGSRLFLRLEKMVAKIVCYDPLKSLSNPQFVSAKIDELYDCDLIAIHANLHNTPPFPSKNLINLGFLENLKPDCAIINAARGDILVEDDLLSLSKKIFYCTDVYSNEPNISSKLIDFALLATPHIAGHTLESKFNILKILSGKLYEKYNLSWQVPTASFNQSKAKRSSWQNLRAEDKILLAYNPQIESENLKKAQDKRTAFLELRQNHKRYSFSSYQELFRDDLLILEPH